MPLLRAFPALNVLKDIKAVPGGVCEGLSVEEYSAFSEEEVRILLLKPVVEIRK